jgi:hypothetical protein
VKSTAKYRLLSSELKRNHMPQNFTATLLLCLGLLIGSHQGMGSEPVRIFIFNDSEEALDLIGMTWIGSTGEEEIPRVAFEGTFKGIGPKEYKELLLPGRSPENIAVIHCIFKNGTYQRRSFALSEGEGVVHGACLITCGRGGIELSTIDEVLPHFRVASCLPLFAVNVGDFLEPKSAATGKVDATVWNNLSVGRLPRLMFPIAEVRTPASVTERRDRLYWQMVYTRACASVLITETSQPRARSLLASRVLYPELAEELNNPFLEVDSASPLMRRLLELEEKASLAAWRAVQQFRDSGSPR